MGKCVIIEKKGGGRVLVKQGEGIRRGYNEIGEKERKGFTKKKKGMIIINVILVVKHGQRLVHDPKDNPTG